MSFLVLISNIQSTSKRPFLPNNKKYGEQFVLRCFVLLYANVNFLIWFFQLDLQVVGNVLSMFIIVLFILSHSPFPIGWYMVVRDGLLQVISDKRLNSLLLNSFIWSCKIRFGNPKSRKYLLSNKSTQLSQTYFCWKCLYKFTEMVYHN